MLVSVSNANESLRWGLACRRNGVRLTMFLALSRAIPLEVFV